MGLDDAIALYAAVVATVVGLVTIGEYRAKRARIVVTYELLKQSRPFVPASASSASEPLVRFESPEPELEGLRVHIANLGGRQATVMRVAIAVGTKATSKIPLMNEAVAIEAYGGKTISLPVTELASELVRRPELGSIPEIFRRAAEPEEGPASEMAAVLDDVAEVFAYNSSDAEATERRSRIILRDMMRREKDNLRIYQLQRLTADVAGGTTVEVDLLDSGYRLYVRRQDALLLVVRDQRQLYERAMSIAKSIR